MISITDNDTIVLAEQTFEGFINAEQGIYAYRTATELTQFTVGQTYLVMWDGTEYECVATELDGVSVLGNTAIFGGVDTGESFLFGVGTAEMTGADSNQLMVYTTDTATSHTVAIYISESEEDTEGDSSGEANTGTNIVLYDRTGAAVTYEGVETITTDTPVEGVRAIFTRGVLMEGAEVELNMAAGDQALSVPDGYLIKEATLKKPETLLPENIKKNVEIAGVVGEFAGDEQEKTVDLNMAEGDQVIEADENTVMTKVTVRRPDTLTPGNVAKGIEIGGVVGTASVTEFDFTDENLKYFGYQIDNANKQVILCNILYNKIYEDTGSYDVVIPNKLGNYDVVIMSED